MIRSLFLCPAYLRHHAASECRGGLDECLVVERCQRLQRRIGSRPAFRAYLTAWSVKRHQSRVGGGAPPKCVEPAAVLVAACARDPFVATVRIVPHAVGLVWEHAGSADFAA